MAKKSKKRRKVLAASCILAALIVAGSSFAWFTSKDEVVNRLSATANYGVTIAEDFQPPENWVPGQTVDKNVGVVNTGNVDAFVRTWLEGEMKVLNQTSSSTAVWGTGAFTIDLKDIATDLNEASTFTNIKDTTDAAFAKMNLTKQYTDTTNKTTYFKSLSSNAQDNPNNSTNNSVINPANNTKYSEVQATQAGGILAYAPDNAEYEYILNQDTWMSVITGDAKETSYTNVPKGTRVVVLNAADTSNHKVTLSADGQSIATFKVVDSANTVYVPAQASAANFVPVNIDSETFKPLTPGLYLFARNVNMTEETNAAITANYEFGGYYYSDFDTVPTYTTSNVSFAHTQKNNKDTVSSTTAKGEFGQGTYYALKYNEDGNSDCSVLGTTYKEGDTVPTTNQVSAKVDPATGELLLVQPTANLELFTATQTVSENTDFNWKYVAKTVKYTPYTKGDKTYYLFEEKVFNSIEDIKKDKVTTDTESSTLIDKAYITNNSNGYTSGTAVAVNDSADMIYASNGDIIVDIELANINNAPDAANAETWTVLKDETTSPKNKYTFYYNNDVEEGDTTEKLVESVKLDESITKDDYMAFDFDLNVKMESVQVTIDDDGKETAATAKTEFQSGAPVNISATGVTVDNDGSEIRSLTWSNT